MALDIFPDFRTPLKSWTNAFVDHLVVSYGDAFEAISGGLLVVLVRRARLRATLGQEPVLRVTRDFTSP